MSATALYCRDGAIWHPEPTAKGPFRGQHGGAVAGVLAAAMEAHAGTADAGPCLQFTMQLLRPAPMEPVRVTVDEVRRGGRMLVLDAAMVHAERLCARATAVFVRELAIAGIPEPTREPVAPGGDRHDIGPFADGVWMADAIDMRRAADGRFWLRHLVPIVAPMGPLARVVSLADWTSGLTRPDWFGHNDVQGFPNADLTVHLARPPEGPWLGIDGQPHWAANGLGLTGADLFDRSGWLGRAAQSIVLVAAG